MLPDKVLRQIFARLTPRDLLQVRGVCRQWRDLALDCCLWTSKIVCAKSDGPQLVAAVLRLAPTVGSLVLWQWEEFVNVSGLLLATTNCAIHHLILRIPAVDATLAALVLKRQGSLGHLVQVQLEVTLNEDDRLPNSRVRALLQELVYIEGIRVLCVLLHSERGRAPLVDSPPLLNAAQLQKAPPPAALLCLAGDDFPESPLLLEWHKPTLEAVEFSSSSCPGAAALLSGAPCLYNYTGSIMPGMLRLLECPKLWQVNLHVELDESTRPELPEVQGFLLAAASRLEKVSLSFQVGREDTADLERLMMCLAGYKSTVSALKVLALSSCDAEEVQDPEPRYLRPLVAILPRLPNLFQLDIDGAPSAALLQALEGRMINLRSNIP